MLGARERFDAVPFFWTQQHDLLLDYVGHATQWDRIDIDGRLEAKNCTGDLPTWRPQAGGSDDRARS